MNKARVTKAFQRINVLPARAFAIFMGVWGVIEALGNWSIKPYDNNFLGFILTVIILVLVTEFAIYYFKIEKSRGNLIDALTDEAERMLDEKRYDEILRRRNILSRTLWVEGKPNERIKLGEIAKEAAIRTGDIKTQTEILIDDLGWTLVSVQRYKEAKEYLEHGLNSAISIKDNYLAAKANRHLAGILLEAKSFQQAKEKMQNAEAFAQQITDEKKKNEMLAGIYYGLSVILLQEKNTQKALEYAEESEKLRISIDDQTRYVKIYSLKGTIYEAQGNKNLAEENFIKGLEVSTKLRRTDEMIRNHLGLARIAKSRNDEKRHDQHVNIAEDLLKKTPIPFKIDEKEISLIQIGLP